MPICAAMVWIRRSVRSMLGAPLARARAAEDEHYERERRVGVFLERHQVFLHRAQGDAQLDGPVEHRARRLDVGMHGILDGAHAIFLHAAIIACEQHGPLCQRHKDRVVHFELDGQLYLAGTSVEAGRFDVRLQTPQDRGMCLRIEARGLEVGRQPHLKHVDLFVGRPERLRVGAAKRHELRVEGIPDACVGVAAPTRRDVDARNTCEVRQRRHVHDRHAGNPGIGHRIAQDPRTPGERYCLPTATATRP